MTDINDPISSAQPSSPSDVPPPVDEDGVLPLNVGAFGGHEAADLEYAADELARKQSSPESEPDELALAAAMDEQARQLLAASFVDERMVAFNDAIKGHPDAAINYVLRAELYLERGNRGAAAEDLLTAILLSEDKETDWEYINRAVLDRARQGLRRCGFSF